MKNNSKRHTTPQSLNAAVKNICDIMRRSNCAGALQYVHELTWILFLRILDERKQHEAEAAAAVGVEFIPRWSRPIAGATGPHWEGRRPRRPWEGHGPP